MTTGLMERPMGILSWTDSVTVFAICCGVRTPGCSSSYEMAACRMLKFRVQPRRCQSTGLRETCFFSKVVGNFLPENWNHAMVFIRSAGLLLRMVVWILF